ncbi:MAG: ribonuclease P protein component [Actinomycetota bacterium]|nr:ribonuclease P protein component [Actinomycetota bacterium]
MSRPTLRSKSEFQAVYHQGIRGSGNLVTLHLLRKAGAEEPKIGLTVSKKIGGAVSRNRLRRRLKEILAKAEIPDGCDLVVQAKPLASNGTFQELEQDVLGTLGKMTVNGN